MAQAANGEPLTVEGALQTIQRLEGLEVGLHRRTEGITWMVWGLITAAIYFTYSTVGIVYGDDFPVWGQFLWAPWVGAGVLATYAVWRSAHLSAEVHVTPRRGLREMAPFLLFFPGLFWAGWLVYGGLEDRLSIKEPGYVLIILSLASLAVSGASRRGSTSAARAMLLVVGVLGLIVSGVLGAVTYPDEDAAYAVQTVVGVAVAGGGWFLGGFWLTLKG